MKERTYKRINTMIIITMILTIVISIIMLYDKPNKTNSYIDTYKVYDKYIDSNDIYISICNSDDDTTIVLDDISYKDIDINDVITVSVTDVIYNKNTYKNHKEYNIILDKQIYI